MHDDQATTGTVGSRHQHLGSIMVVCRGHPLVGCVLPVTRPYHQDGEPQWEIELADGSRQRVPASWCTPLRAGLGSGSAGEVTMDGAPPPASQGNPLSLTALRDL